MTEEQFKRVVEINERLNKLNDVKYIIKNVKTHCLSYSYLDNSREYRICLESLMRPIKELLDKHDRMIREEIDEEIKKLQEEIKAL